MKFQLRSSKHFFTDAEVGRYKELGFIFDPPDDDYDKWYLRDIYPEIEMADLGKLAEFSRRYGDEIVVNFDEMWIEIYNDYRE